MDIQPPNSQPDNCSKHNQPILIYNSDPKIGACCIVCLQQQPGNISVEQLHKQQNEIYEQANKKIDFNHQIYQQLFNKLVSYKQRIIISLDKIYQYANKNIEFNHQIYQQQFNKLVNNKQIIIISLDKIIQTIFDQIKILKESKTKLNNIIISNSNQQQRLNQLQETLNNQIKKDKQIKDQVKQQLNELPQKFTNRDEYMKLLSRGLQQVKLVSENCQKISIKEVKVEQRETSEKFQFQLIKESSIKEENYCLAFAFNKDNTILVVAIERGIVIYEFKDGKIMKEFQKLNHQSEVNYLYFMKKSNSFISFDYDQKIIIWVLNLKNKWVEQQTIKVAMFGVRCFLMNKMENQLISANYDRTIIFWGNSEGSWKQSQTIETRCYVENMSLNEMQDKLIVCKFQCSYRIFQKYNYIQVLMQQNKNQWEVVQTMEFQFSVQLLGFTVGDQFIFRIKDSDELLLYHYDTEIKEFQQVKSIQIHHKSWEITSYQFIKSLRIITFLNENYLNIIKIDQSNYQLLQQIQFEADNLYSRISDDGQYIVTWDNGSQEIQFRKIKYDI